MLRDNVPGKSHVPAPPPGAVPFVELPADRAHRDIARTDARLRALVGAPDDVPLVQWRIGSLGCFSRNLAGCLWRIVGVRVPPVDTLPGWPFMQVDWPPGSPPMCLQAWLWRTSKGPHHRPYADLLWDPEAGRSMSIGGITRGCTAAEVLLARRWLLETDQQGRGGRPLGSGIFPDRQSFLHAVVPEVKRCWRDPSNSYPSRERVAALLPDKPTARTLGKKCREYLGVKWNTFVQEVRRKM